MARTSPRALSEPHLGKRRVNWMKVREQITGYAFIFPAVFLIAMFGVFPIGYAFYMSLHRWRVRQGPFIGIDNYNQVIGDWLGLLIFLAGAALLGAAYALWNRAPAATTRKRERVARNTKLASLAAVAGGLYVISLGWARLIAEGDGRFLSGLERTIYYATGTVPVQIVLALILASALYQKIRGKEFFRMIYFLPYITPAVAAAAVFRVLFSSRDTGLINSFLGLFGLQPLRWLQEANPISSVFFGLELGGFFAGPSLALVVAMMFGIWNFFGYNVVIFLAGLSNIPQNLYEAAEIDGATKVQSFFHITIPLLSPMTLFLALNGMIGTLQAFNHIYVMRTPGALGSLDTASIVIFNTFYERNQFGLAAAQAVLLFFLILSLTVMTTKVFSKRVHYGW